jgi:hypothetical protein
MVDHKIQHHPAAQNAVDEFVDETPVTLIEARARQGALKHDIERGTTAVEAFEDEKRPITWIHRSTIPSRTGLPRM